MRRFFSSYLPPRLPQALGKTVDVSLTPRVRTCRAQKGNFLGPAAKEGIAILFPDTSPRGAGIEGETDSWEIGRAHV